MARRGEKQRDIFRTSRRTGIVLGAIIVGWNLYLAWHQDSGQVLITAAVFGVLGAALLGASLGRTKQQRYRLMAVIIAATVAAGAALALTN